MDEEVHERGIVDRVGPDAGESSRVGVGALAERRGERVTLGRGRGSCFVARERPEGQPGRHRQLVGREAERSQRAEHRVVCTRTLDSSLQGLQLAQIAPAEQLPRVAREHDNHRVAAELVLVADVVGVHR